MNPPPATLPGGWSRRRFWSVAFLLFAAQVGLILFFGGGGRGAVGTPAAPGQFRLLERPMTAGDMSKLFYASDPQVFAGLTAHGFSGRAWLNEPSSNYDVPQESEPPEWLRLDISKLATNFPSLNHLMSAMALGPVQPRATEPEPWPIFLTPESIESLSVFQMRGSLAARQLNAPAELRSWPSALLLSNTVVQIAVNSAGQVVSARFGLHGRSGLAEADSNALAIARGLRFKPAPQSSPVWGDAVFAWQTIEPTNAAGAGTP